MQWRNLPWSAQQRFGEYEMDGLIKVKLFSKLTKTGEKGPEQDCYF